MRNKLLLILCAAFLCACEGLKDDRNRPVPDNPVIAWLLSVEIDKLPSGTVAYGCRIDNITHQGSDNYCEFLRDEIKLPELLKIPGASIFVKNKPHIIQISSQDADGNIVELIDTIPHCPIIANIDTTKYYVTLVDTIWMDGGVFELDTVDVPFEKYDTTYIYTQKLEYKENGIEFKLHVRYD